MYKANCQIPTIDSDFLLSFKLNNEHENFTCDAFIID